MGMAHVGLVHRDPCECKVKGFRAVSSIERNVSKRRHLQRVRHRWTWHIAGLWVGIHVIKGSPNDLVMFPGSFYGMQVILL